MKFVSSSSAFAPRWRWFASCSLSCSLVLVTFFPRPVSASTCHPFVPVLDLFMLEIHTALHNSALTLPIYTCQFAPGTVRLKDSRGTTSRTRFIVPGTQPEGLDEIIRVRNHEPFSAVGLEERIGKYVYVIVRIDCLYIVHNIYNIYIHTDTYTIIQCMMTMGWNKIAWCHLKSNRFDPHRV